MRWLLLFLLIIPLASSEPTLNIPNETIQPGETLIGTVEGTAIKEITNSHIQFYEGRKKTFFETEIQQHNNTYYFYSYLHRPGNFTLQIERILYTENGTIKEKTIAEPIVVQERIIAEKNSSGTQILSIKPGILNYKEKQAITLQNIGTLPIEIRYNKETITLNKTNTHTLTFDKLETFTLLDITAYKKTFTIPLIPSTEEPTKPRLRRLDVLTTKNETLNLNVPTEKEVTQTITLTNIGNQSITTLSVSSDIPFIRAIPTNVTIIQNESTNITLSIAAEGRGTMRGFIEATYQYENESGILKIPITLLIVPKGFDTQNITRSPLTCKDEGGTICKENEFCNGDATYSKDGNYCCLAQCITIQITEEGSNTGLIIGIVILTILGVIGFFAYRKQKKVKATNPLQKQSAYGTAPIQKTVPGTTQRPSQNNNKEGKQPSGGRA